MMKSALVLYLFICSFLCINAQVTDVLTDLNQPISIKFYNNELFFMEYYSGAGKMSKVNIDSSSEIIELATDLGWSIGLAFKNENVFFGEIVAQTISKFDLSTNTIASSSYISNSRISDLEFNNDILYFAEYDTDKISFADISVEPPIKNELVSGLSYPYSIAIKDNVLYFSQSNANKISKINLLEFPILVEDVITNLAFPVGIYLVGDLLFIAEFDANKISYIDITSNQISATDLVTNLVGPVSIGFYGNELYFTQYDANKISKIDITSLLSVEDLNADENEYTVFPNPTKDFLFLSNINSGVEFQIVNTIGKILVEGKISDDQKIDIKELAPGIYYLKTKNGLSEKFIKK